MDNDSRKPRKKSVHKDVDLFKPLKVESVMSTDKEANGDDACFTKKWKPGNTRCNICADHEICGILYTKRQSKAIKQIDAKLPTPLDVNDFDGIKDQPTVAWLKQDKRTFKDFVGYISKLANCADIETVKFWCKSFAKRHKIASADGVLIFK